MWIACDWGTSACRVWLMEGDRPLAARRSDDGMGGLSPEGFEPALLALIGDWLDSPMDVLICGMAGARQGWVEAPYRATPCALDGTGAILAPTGDPRLTVRILPGVSQSDPPDVMRGEETQAAGFLATHPGWTGTLCLPGTHTKWIEVRHGRLVEFRSVMTGEVFALLSTRSVLRHSIGDTMDERAFQGAVDQARADPNILPRLFSLRAADLLAGQPPEIARGRLSGWLIGAEVAGQSPDGPVVIIADDPMARLYRMALSQSGRQSVVMDATEATLAGLAQAHRQTGRRP